jgi:hypothetical protein
MTLTQQGKVMTVGRDKASGFKAQLIYFIFERLIDLLSLTTCAVMYQREYANPLKRKKKENCDQMFSLAVSRLH